MSFPVYEHRITVTNDGVSPQGPLNAGVYGDERAARITFDVSALSDAAAYCYRVEVVDGAGAYDITPRLAVQNNTVAWDIPTGWTTAGTAALRLVQLAVDGQGIETARRYFKPVLLGFDYRDEGNGTLNAAPLWQEALTRAEAALEEASAAAAAASQAAETATHAAAGADALARTAAADAALAAAAAADARTAAQNAVKDATAAGAGYAVRAETAATRAELAEDACQDTLEQVEDLSGIAEDIRELAGEGDAVWHPCVTVDTALDESSDNPLANRAVAAALGTKANTDHAHAADTVPFNNDTDGFPYLTGGSVHTALGELAFHLSGHSHTAGDVDFSFTNGLNFDSGDVGTALNSLAQSLAYHEHWASAIPCNAGGYSTVEVAIASLCTLVGDLRNRVASLENRLVGSGW